MKYLSKNNKVCKTTTLALLYHKLIGQYLNKHELTKRNKDMVVQLRLLVHGINFLNDDPLIIYDNFKVVHFLL